MDWCCWHALIPAQDRILLLFKAIMLEVTVRDQQHFGALYLCPAVSAPFFFSSISFEEGTAAEMHRRFCTG